MSRIVVVKGSSGLRQVVTIGPHRLLADEGKDVGSADKGPDPYEYLLAALGTCTNMTVRMYANRKRWPLRGIRTTLSHSKSHTADCEHCEQPTAMVDRIEMQITFLGELSEEQRNRLLQIADRCPVHRTLTSKIVIHTALGAPRHTDRNPSVRN
jgi:putative redox protein